MIIFLNGYSIIDKNEKKLYDLKLISILVRELEHENNK